MKGKTAIITGAGRGIGRAVAVRLAKAGANVVINYLGNEKAAKETEDLCLKEGAGATVVRGDVSCEEDCIRIVKTAVETFGTVDILVNNAGITRDGLLLRMDEKDFESVTDTNLKGTFLMTKTVIRDMMKKRSGKIINVSSIVGIQGNTGQANYAAAKAGIIGFTKAAAREMAAKGININAVAPGFIETDMTAAMTDKAAETVTAAIPSGRLGKPEDVAETVAFLAGKESDYITGQIICVDGGLCMK